METKVKSSQKKRLRRKNKREMRLLRIGSQTRSKSLGIRKISKKMKKQRLKLKENCLKSLFEGFYEHQVSMAQNQESIYEKYIQQKKNPLEETIDLCDGENSLDNLSSGVAVVPSCDVEPNSETVIDLSAEVPEQMEIIDLTETLSAPLSDCNTNNSLEPTVIDISDDSSKENTTNVKLESDEISVIGMFNKAAHFNNKCNISPSVSLSNKFMNFNNLVDWSDKLKRKYMTKQFMLDNRKVTCNTKSECSISAKVAKVGENIYVNSPVTFPSTGLRPIIIDGSNVAFVRSSSNFSCKRLEICINYFKEKGHKVTAFVPQFRISPKRCDDPELLRKLERQGDVVLTPSKKIDGRNIVPYDDRFIVQTAVLKGGIIVTRDNYNDLLRENPAWAETIKYRTLAFTWVDDVLMFPKDPLGEFGPSLEEFLRFH